MRRRIYVAGPLGSDPEKRVENVKRAVEAGMELFRAGYAPLVPHLTHYIDPDDSLGGYDNWIDVDLAWVEVADGVLRIPGHSPGADREVKHANEKGVPVFLSMERLENFRWSVMR